MEEYPCATCGHVCGNVTPSDVTKLREVHSWLSELMPAARVAMKMLNARSALASRWRGGKKDA